MCSLASSVWAQDSTSGSSSNVATPYEGGAGQGPIRIGMLGAESVPISISMTLDGSYDTLLGAFRVDKDGKLTPGSGSYGVDGGFTISGQKKLRRAVFGISYLANYNHFFNASNFNGSNQSINLAYSRRMTKRTELTLNTAGSISNRVLGNLLNRQTDGFEFFSAPTNELFDARIYFLQSSMALGYRLNNRWQLQFSGNGGVVRRQARALADTNLFGGAVGANYRLNRRSSLGLTYTYSHFDFGKQFGESDINGVSGNYSRELGRGWQASAHVSIFDVRTVGVRRVALDPVIAALLGANQGSEAFRNVTRTPGFGANVSKRIRLSSYSVGTERGVQPGNGLILTSIVSTYTASANYQLKAKWSMTALALRSKMDSIGTGNLLGAFSSDSFQVRLTRKLTREIGFTGGVEYRKFKIEGSSFDRSGSRVSFGLNYAPTSLPFGK